MRTSSRTTLGPLLLTLLLLAPGCVAAGRPWSFSMTRQVYGSQQSMPNIVPENADGSTAIVVAGLFLLPLAIDVVLLPITLPHDLFFVE